MPLETISRPPSVPSSPRRASRLIAKPVRVLASRRVRRETAGSGARLSPGGRAQPALSQAPHLRFAVVLLGLVLACPMLCVTPSVSAQEASPEGGVAEAERYAADAYEAYSKQDYATAVMLYLKAYEAAPSAAILFNIARIYDTGVRDRPLAMTFYRRYIAETDAEPERIRQANQRLMELRAAESAATAATAPAANTTPQQSAPPPAAASAAPTTSAPPPVERSGGLGPLGTAGILTSCVGLAGIGTGAVFGVLAKNSRDKAEEDCEGNRCTSSTGVDALRSAQDRATVSTVAWIAGGVLLATGITMLIVDPGSEAEPTSAQVMLSPIASHTQLGASLSGRW